MDGDRCPSELPNVFDEACFAQPRRQGERGGGVAATTVVAYAAAVTTSGTKYVPSPSVRGFGGMRCPEEAGGR